MSEGAIHQCGCCSGGQTIVMPLSRTNIKVEASRILLTAHRGLLIHEYLRNNE